MASRIDSSGISVISEEKVSARKHHDSNSDYELTSNHKIKSAYGGGNKKKIHPLMLGPSRQSQGKLISLHSASKNNLSEFTQRIMSAKLLRVKQVQNQLTETQIQLNELINENRILRNLQKRQEGALRRYEGNHAELPQLIRSHNEEIRTLKANNKLIKAQLRESNTKLKERETELEALRDSYNKLKKLSNEKNLLDREKLQKKVDNLMEVIKEQEEKIQVLSRKILLESKNYRHHLNVEVLKHKETQKDLNSALTMINKLENQLMTKDRSVSGGKMLLKRESKSIMPILANKSIDIQPKTGVSEDSFLDRDEGKKKFQIGDSPDLELELLNVHGSSDDTSPTQDIFPDIMRSRKSSLEIEKINERSFSKSEILEYGCEISKNPAGGTTTFKKSPFPMKSSRFSTDVETKAKVIAEKLAENMDTIDDLTQKVENNSSSEENKSRLSLLYEEMNENSFKLESELISSKSIKSRSAQEKILEESDLNVSDRDRKKLVPKRKFEENPKKQSAQPTESDFQEELTGAEEQKLATMTKTWNEIKDKIQEERKKAEEKMKELSTLNGVTNVSDSVSSDSETGKPEDSSQAGEIADFGIREKKKELRFVNFTDDAYILQELEKTDKIFNRLKSENKKNISRVHSSSSSSTEKKSKAHLTPNKSTSKPTSKGAPPPPPQPPKPRQQDVKSFRTESQRDPKFLEEFQSEYQKQNLIKALKAIDDEKDPSYSTEDSCDDSQSETETKKGKFNARNSLKKQQQPPPQQHFQKQQQQNHPRLSPEKAQKDLITELFGSKNKLEKIENLKCIPSERITNA